MTPNELIALAAACRKAGIKHYKADGVEFTLSDIAPPKRKRKTAKATSTSDPASDLDPASDGWESLSDDEKLLWSTNPAGSQ